MATPQDPVTLRAVYDCMIFLAAVTNPGGSAGACFAAAEGGRVALFASPTTLAEATDVLNRPRLRRRFPKLTDENVDDFLARLRRVATIVPDVPAVVTLTRDPDDAMYLDLALAAGAEYVVSRDNDLLDLMTSADPEPAAFRAAYPALRIVTPPEFLRTLRPDPPAPEAP